MDNPETLASTTHYTKYKHKLH